MALPEVRHGFVSGNSAGGLFELKSFSLPDERWESASYGTEHALHHGAFDWDKLNLLGLDFEGRPALSWLDANEPRRVLMGGGSDAHGDFNHRRAGYFLGTDDANDTAIGKPRNLVLAGNPEGPIIYDARPINENVRDDRAGGVPNPGIDPGLIIDPVLDPSTWIITKRPKAFRPTAFSSAPLWRQAVIIRSRLEPLHHPPGGRHRWSRRTVGCTRKSPDWPPLRSSQTASRVKTDGRS